jgi:acyl-CoA thioesterase FadM
MARVQIALPDQFPFATEIEVRITDLNYGRHLGNDSMLSLLHEARVRFLAAHGMNEGDVGGRMLIMADAAVVYRAEAFAGDRLKFEVAVADVGRAACDLVYRVTRPTDGRLVAEAKTGVVFLDAATRKVVRLPDELARLAAG